MMFLHSDQKPLTCCLSIIRVLFFYLCLTNVCRGQTELIGSSQPIVVTLGDDIILPCYLVPAKNCASMTLEWTRPDLDPRFVYVWRAGQELLDKKHKSFEGRTSLFVNELKKGNISLQLSKVTLSDHGIYRCFIPAVQKQTFVQLIIASDAVSSPILTLSGVDTDKGGVVLQCESKGWYPEPEVLWLDSEGNLLSAGPTETVRGPDDLYTVSSRVTVEKRHSNNITCRVQQRNINQTRETHIHVPDEFFNTQSSSTAVIAGSVVGLAVCFMFILLLVILWKKQIIFISKKNKEKDQIQKTKNQIFTAEREREQLMNNETVQLEMNNKNVKIKTKHEQLKRKEAKEEVKTLNETLDTKRKEAEEKQAELQQLQEEKQSIENNLQALKIKLESKENELKTIKATEPGWFSWPSTWREHERKKTKAEREKGTMKKELESTEKELLTKTKEFKDKQTEVQQLQHEIRMTETSQQMAVVKILDME